MVKISRAQARAYNTLGPTYSLVLATPLASSSLLEMPPPVRPPSGLMWHFPSNSSSGNVSQENMLLHSSHSDITDPNVMAAPQYHLQPTAHDVTRQKSVPWYRQTSLASLSTPTPVADHNHGSSSSMTVFPPRYHYSMSPTVGLPMCRSMSQDYHKPLPKNHYSVPHRRHTFTPADRQQKGTQRRVVQALQDNSRFSEVSEVLPQNQIYSAQLPTCQNSFDPDTHCGQLGHRIHPVSPSGPHMRFQGHCQPYTPARHFSSERSSQGTLRKGWESEKYGEESIATGNKYSPQILIARHRQLTQINDQPTVDECEYLRHHSKPCNCIHTCQQGDIESSDAESESSVAIVSRNEDYSVDDRHLKQQNATCIKKRNSVPIFQSQCLDVRKDTHSTMSAHSQRQSLDVSALKRGSKCMSTSSASTGNASTSNRSLTSMNTLTGSVTNCKSPVSSPPIIRNKGIMHVIRECPIVYVVKFRW